MYVIIGTLVTNIGKMPFVSKTAQRKYVFDIWHSAIFSPISKIYCALAYLFDSKFEMHQTCTVLPTLVDAC